MTVVIMAVGMLLPMGPWAGYFKPQALPYTFFLWVTAILMAYCVCATLLKRFYIHRFGWH